MTTSTPNYKGNLESDQDASSLLCSLNPVEKPILYAAGSNNQELRPKVKMQRVLFLASEAFPKAFGEELSFESHKTGPHP